MWIGKNGMGTAKEEKGKKCVTGKSVRRSQIERKMEGTKKPRKNNGKVDEWTRDMDRKEQNAGYFCSKMVRKSTKTGGPNKLSRANEVFISDTSVLCICFCFCFNAGAQCAPSVTLILHCKGRRKHARRNAQ